ncbi:UNVERIFIED_CONTAM: hypothetical protein HDU68_004177 [Siphonaria sp. JEL0065]|nr:hypothetical protein HDU68_004177 [Siphonaria sp. JEL0065]
MDDMFAYQEACRPPGHIWPFDSGYTVFSDTATFQAFCERSTDLNAEQGPHQGPNEGGLDKRAIDISTTAGCNKFKNILELKLLMVAITSLFMIILWIKELGTSLCHNLKPLLKKKKEAGSCKMEDGEVEKGRGPITQVPSNATLA